LFGSEVVWTFGRCEGRLPGHRVDYRKSEVGAGDTNSGLFAHNLELWKRESGQDRDARYSTTPKYRSSQPKVSSISLFRGTA